MSTIMFPSIQCHWRGYRARMWYSKYRDSVPPTHPTLRTKHFEKKLTSLTSRMVDSCTQRTSEAASLLTQLDESVRAARAAMKLCDEGLMAAEVNWEDVCGRAREQLATDCAVCLCPLVIGDSAAQHLSVVQLQQQPHPPHQQCATVQPHPPWCAEVEPHSKPTETQSRPFQCIIQRASTQPHPHVAAQPHPPQAVVRLLSVLSCGHVLHEVCIKALERFAAEDTPHLCPLCRAPYQRITAYC